jgi:hypothetical protein
VAQAFRPSLVPGHVVQAQPAISLRAKYGLVMDLKPLPDPTVDKSAGVAVPAAALLER